MNGYKLTESNVNIVDFNFPYVYRKGSTEALVDFDFLICKREGGTDLVDTSWPNNKVILFENKDTMVEYNHIMLKQNGVELK